MKEPDKDTEEAIFLLFPELKDKVFPNWERLEFTEEARQQIGRVRMILRRERDLRERLTALAQTWDNDFVRGYTMTPRKAAHQLRDNL